MGPKKNLGQHFLTSPAVAERIALAVPVAALDDARVLEIGPGRGALSVHLARRFPLLRMVEIDRDAIKTLKEKLGMTNRAGDGELVVTNPNININDNNTSGAITPGLVIHNEDVMKFDFAKAGFPLHVVGNLPYNIGALIIKKTLLYAPHVLSCTFMVQREVAARVVSEPHSKENGWLSIFCQFFGDVRMLFRVPPGAFFPRPNVDSAVFQIIVDKDVESKLPRDKWTDFFSFVDAGFSMRRKQLAKILSLKFSRDKEFYAEALSSMGAGAAARPEDLDAGAWLDLYKRAGE